MNALIDLTCAFPDRLDETDFMYIRNRPKHGKEFVLEKEMLLTNSIFALDKPVDL